MTCLWDGTRADEKVGHQPFHNGVAAFSIVEAHHQLDDMVALE